MPQRGNFLGLGLVADSAGKSLDALAVAGGLGGNRSGIPYVIAGCGQVFYVFRRAAGLAGTVNAASLTAGSRGGGLVPVVTRGLDGLRLGLVADGAGVQLLPCLGAGSGLGHNAVIPFVVFSDRQVFDVLGIAAALANVLDLARILAGRRGGDFLVIMAQRVGVVVLVGFFGVLVAGVQRVALLGAGGVNHSHRKCVLLRRDGLGVGVGRVVLAGKGHCAVALVGRFFGNLARIPLVAELGNSFGLGVAGIIFTSVGFNTVRLAGCRGSDLAVVPVVAQRGDVLGLGVAGIVLAGVGFHAVCLASCGCRDNTVIPVMAECCNGFRLCFGAAIVGAFVGFLALGLAGGRGGNRTVIPLVTQCGDSLGLRVAGIALTNVSQHTLCGASCRGRNRAIIPFMAECSNSLGLGLGAAIVCAFVGLFTLGLTGRRGGDFAVIPLVPQCRDGLGLRCAVAGAGVGHHTLCRAGCRSRDNAVVVIMAEGGSIVALLGQVLVLVADVDGVALLGAGRSDGLALVPCLIQHLNVLGAGLAASRAGKGLDTLLVNRCGLGDNTAIPAVGQLGGVLALVGQAGNLVALVNRVALGCAGRRNDLFDMVGFIQLRRFLGAGLAAVFASVSNCTLFVVGGLLGDNARAPVVAVGGNVVVVVVHTAPLLADVLVVARRRAACGVLADDVSVGDGLRRSRGCRSSSLCRCFGRICRFTGLTALVGAGIVFAAVGIAALRAGRQAAVIGAALLALAVGGFCCRFRRSGRGRRGRGCSRCWRSGRRFSLRAGRLALTGGCVGCVRRGF